MHSCPYPHHPHSSSALHAQSQPWAFKGCRNRAWPCLGIGAQGQAFLLAPSPAWCHATSLNVILLVTSRGLHGNLHKVTAPRSTIWLAGGLCHDPFTAQYPTASLLTPLPVRGGTLVGCCVPLEARQRVPRSQAQGAPAAPGPVSRLGSMAKAPATHDGALRAGGRAGAFKRPSGVRAAAAVGTHVNSTRVRGGHSTSHMPAPSACSCPFLH